MTPQGDAAGWTVTVRLAGEGAAGREVALEGLRGGTRVEEVLGLAAASLGVRAGADVAFESAFECGTGAVEEALAHLTASDFDESRREQVGNASRCADETEGRISPPRSRTRTPSSLWPPPRRARAARATRGC